MGLRRLHSTFLLSPESSLRTPRCGRSRAPMRRPPTGGPPQSRSTSACHDAKVRATCQSSCNRTSVPEVPLQLRSSLRLRGKHRLSGVCSPTPLLLPLHPPSSSHGTRTREFLGSVVEAD
ncbi:hypothetical protein MRX96_043199 [Rhipicephalus microplus]